MKKILGLLSLLVSLNIFAIDYQEALERSYEMLEQPISLGAPLESLNEDMPKFTDISNAPGDPKVLMLIDGPLYPSIAEGITNYIDGVESTLPFDIIEFHNQEWRTQTFAETRAFIKSQWESQDIKGVILVGFFPYMHYNLPGQVRYIADGSRDDGMIGMIGYEDLDGEFLDLGAWTKNVTGVYEFISGPANGVYDHHVWKTDGTPYDYNTDNTIDIWCALMRPFQAAEGSYEYTPAVVDQMNDFFEKLDKYYSAEMVVPQRGLAYCNKDWGNVTPGLATILSDHYGTANTDSAGGSGVYNSAQDYMHYLGRGYEMCNLWSHSSGWFHDFDRYPWRGLQNYELLNRNGRGSMITWGFNCHGSDFAEAQTTGCMGQNYIFSGIGQVYISSAMSYGVSYADRQMTWMTEGEYIGEAFRRGVEDEYKGNSGFRALTNTTIVCQTFNGNPLLYTSDANRVTASPATASGTIKSANQELEFKLIKDNELFSYETSNLSGDFTFSFLEAGRYLVKVYTVGGYQIGVFEFDIASGATKDLGTVNVGVAATNDNTWHYSVTDTMPSGWENASTDMSAYSSGPAPFGYQSDKGTFLELNSRIYMRKVFDISTTSETRDIRLTVRSYEKTDQNVGATVNGNNVSFETVGTSPDYWMISADISSYLIASNNVVVVWGSNYLDASAPEYLIESQPIPEYELVVESGSGSGTYEAGTKVNISANAASSGKIFDKWLGDVENIDNIYAKNAVLTMPYDDVIIVSSYKTVPSSSAVYEYFDYATDSDPTGETGGNNWVSAWEMISGSAGWASVREALVYTDVSENTLWTAGNNIALHPQGDGSAKMRRKFSAKTSGEFYFSILVKPVTAHGGYDYAISLGNDSTESLVSMIARGWGDQYWLVNDVRPATLPIPAVGTTQMIVGKVNLSNNTVDFWSNPDLLNPGTADHSTTYSSSLGSISQIVLYQQANSSIAGNVINSFDEIRFGNSWQEVAPIVTPSYALIVENGSGSGAYSLGDSVTITADTYTGKSFVEWSGDTSNIANLYSSSTTITMPAGDLEIYPSYDKYTLSVDQGSGSGTYIPGTSVNIIADTAPTGQVFARWFGDTIHVTDINSTSTTVTMPTEDMDIRALYTPITYDLTVNYGSGSGSYEFGEVVDIIADTSGGKVFEQWTGDTGYVADIYSASTTVTIPGEIIVTATFEPPATAYDGFDYDESSNPDGQNGGLAWAGAWDMTSGSEGWASFCEPLSYVDNNLRFLNNLGENIALHPQGDAACTMEREFFPRTNGEFYFSFLVKPVTYHNGYDYRIALGNDSNADLISMIARGWGDQNWLVNDVRPATLPIPAVGTTQLIVAKVNMTNNTVDFWSNPDLLTPDSSDYSTTYSTSFVSINQILLYQQSNSSLNGRVTNSFDEIRVGNTWEDVVPNIPEPSMAILLIIGAFLLHRLKK